MKRIIFDIETIGVDWEKQDQLSQEYLLKFADTPAKAEEVRQSLAFYPLTGEIVAIAMLDADTQNGSVYFRHNDGQREKFTDDRVIFISGSEADILNHFWRVAQRADQLVSFNGRMFDGPFIMLRSAINKIPVRKNLVPYRYSQGVHVDLADQMTFYDAMRRRFSLHVWCKAFGIESPKEAGVTGLMVKELFLAGKSREIAQYCLGDVIATKQLFGFWEKYLKV